MPVDLNVFISYARADGADEAEHLYLDLKKQGIEAWRDLHNLDPYTDFSGEIEGAIEACTHIAVCVTPDIRRADSFVRREVAFALALKKPIIPLVFEGGIPPITIINHTWILFHDWDKGFADLLQRLKDPHIREITPETRRQMEIAYLQSIGQKYDHWRDLYTDMAATAQIEERKIKIKGGAAARYLDMQHDMFKTIDHAPDADADKSKIITVENFGELREGLHKYQRVALIGDPGAGKSTTLERLAYELAAESAEKEDAPLPLFVRLGAYEGEDFTAFLENAFGGLRVADYLPKRVFLLLDGLNETPPDHVEKIRQWVEQHQDATLIVTCRKLDYVGLKLPLQRIDVNPLDVTRIHLFIGNYLEDDERETLFWALSGQETHASWEWLCKEQKETTFHNFWFDAGKVSGYDWEPERRHLIVVREKLKAEGKLPDMLGVVSNPFLLFVVIQVFVRQGELPANRGELFRDFVKLLIKHRGKTAVRPDRPWIDEQIQEKALAALAYRMQAEKMGTSVEESWALQVIQESLPPDPTPDPSPLAGRGEKADLLLYFAASASIIERGKQIRFVHQLLQEYFAAFEMQEDIRRGVTASKYFPSEKWWEPTSWEETVLLLAGMEGNCTKLVEWLTPIQPTLAYRCATESGATCSESALMALYDPAIPPIPMYEKGDEVDEWRKKLPRITPLARAEWGRILAEKGDSRPGVGVKNGLPDIDWVVIPGGEFLYQDGEIINLPTFSIACYPITYAQFQAFIDAPDGIKDERWWEGLAEQHFEPYKQYFKYGNHPRENVNWYQAIAFCRWFSWKLGGIYDLDRVMEWKVRLPTEQEWEKAARGTDGRVYPWGNEYMPGYANIDETYDGAGPYYLRSTSAVGMYPQGASPYGVLDMSGNVWEWCLTEYESGQSSDVTNSNVRVVRGGSWDLNDPDSLRAAVRFRNDPDNPFRINLQGLRLAHSY